MSETLASAPRRALHNSPVEHKSSLTRRREANLNRAGEEFGFGGEHDVERVAHIAVVRFPEAREFARHAGFNPLGSFPPAAA